MKTNLSDTRSLRASIEAILQAMRDDPASPGADVLKIVATMDGSELWAKMVGASQVLLIQRGILSDQTSTLLAAGVLIGMMTEAYPQFLLSELPPPGADGPN